MRRGLITSSRIANSCGETLEDIYHFTCAEAQVMANNVRLMQEVANSLDSILHVLNDESGYHAPVQFLGGRRPKIVLTKKGYSTFLTMVSQFPLRLNCCKFH